MQVRFTSRWASTAVTSQNWLRRFLHCTCQCSCLVSHPALVSAKLTFKLPPVEMPPLCFRGLCPVGRIQPEPLCFQRPLTPVNSTPLWHPGHCTSKEIGRAEEIVTRSCSHRCRCMSFSQILRRVCCSGTNTSVLFFSQLKVSWHLCLSDYRGTVQAGRGFQTHWSSECRLAGR